MGQRKREVRVTVRDIKFQEGNDFFNYRVAAMIESDAKYLFQKMPNDTNYTLVGGRVHFMETTKEAMIREVQEEVGYDITNDEFHMVEIAENFFDYQDAEGGIHKVQTLLFIYKIKIPKEVVIDRRDSFPMKDKPNTTLHWLSYEEAKEAPILPSFAKRLLEEDTLHHEIINDCKYGNE